MNRVVISLMVGAATLGFRPAMPGYHFIFPRDHASHPSAKTEWWYYTGHLKTPDGRAYGYELTFFRFGMSRAPLPARASRWRFQDLYVAHFALSDEAGRTFRFARRQNRPGLGLAGASAERYDVFNGTWRVQLLPDGRHHLRARDGDSAIDLVLAASKPPVINGEDGVSRKSDCDGCTSQYYSVTRLMTTGILTVGGRHLPVTGESWMDHEFGFSASARNLAGWDWFSLQLDDNTELMLYRLRLAGGRTEPASSGTFVRADGSSSHLPVTAWSETSSGSWVSPHTGGRYPMGWQVKVPGEALDLSIAPAFDDQELSFGGAAAVTYWEGSARVDGSHHGQPVRGHGYVELTGYANGSRPPL